MNYYKTIMTTSIIFVMVLILVLIAKLAFDFESNEKQSLEEYLAMGDKNIINDIENDLDLSFKMKNKSDDFVYLGKYKYHYAEKSSINSNTTISLMTDLNIKFKFYVTSDFQKKNYDVYFANYITIKNYICLKDNEKIKCKKAYVSSEMQDKINSLIEKEKGYTGYRFILF